MTKEIHKGVRAMLVRFGIIYEKVRIALLVSIAIFPMFAISLAYFIQNYKG